MILNPPEYAMHSRGQQAGRGAYRFRSRSAADGRIVHGVLHDMRFHAAAQPPNVLHESIVLPMVGVKNLRKIHTRTLNQPFNFSDVRQILIQ
jgi:hypothetical protein